MQSSQLRVITYPLLRLFWMMKKTQDAIMYNVIILGEATNRIGQEFQEKHPEIPWSSIIGTRNVIVHGYDQVKLQIIWDILTKDLPSLKNKLQSIEK